MLSVQNVIYWSPLWEGLGREQAEGVLLQESDKGRMLSQPRPASSLLQPILFLSGPFQRAF